MSESSASSIQSYAAFQSYMNNLISSYGTSISGAPHKAFWETYTYEQFISGNVPNVSPPVKSWKWETDLLPTSFKHCKGWGRCLGRVGITAKCRRMGQGHGRQHRFSR